MRVRHVVLGVMGFLFLTGCPDTGSEITRRDGAASQPGETSPFPM